MGEVDRAGGEAERGRELRRADAPDAVSVVDGPAVADALDSLVLAEEPTEPADGEVPAGPAEGPLRVSPVDSLDEWAAAETLLRASRDLHMIVDPFGRCRWASDRVVDILGLTVDEIVGLELIGLVHPDDMNTVMESFWSVVDRGAQVEPAVFRVRHSSDRWVPVETMATALTGPDDKYCGVLMNVRDVTGRRHAEDVVRQTEERFRELVRHSADAVIVLNAVGRTSFVSPSFERLFGWRLEDFKSLDWMALVAPEDQEHVRQFFVGLLHRNAGDPYTARFGLRHRDGRYRWAEVTAVNHLDNSAVRGIVANLRDVSERHEAEMALRASEARFRTVLSGSFDVTAVIDAEGVIRWVTPNSELLLGWRPDEVEGHNGLDFVHPDNVDFLVGELVMFVSGRGIPNPSPIRMRHKDGSWRDVEIVGNDFLDHPDIHGIAINLRDIGERVAMERDRARLTQIFAMTSDLVGTVDSQGRLVYLNEAARRFLQLEPDAPLHDVDISEHVRPSARRRLKDEVIATLSRGETWTGELELFDPAGAAVPVQVQLLAHRDDPGGPGHVSAVVRDISERKSFERRLQHEATHDPLTGLPNRTLLLDRLETALARSRRHNTGMAVLFCDLDNFKVVNDSQGHSHGDRVLTEAARRLERQLRPGDTVSRFGGDEFVILCEDCAGVDDAVQIATRVDEAVSKAFTLDGSEVFVGVSIGIAMTGPGAGPVRDPESLIRDADAAMYRAKELGRGRYQVFERGIWERAVDRFDLENALRRALARGELDILYQPVVALDPDGRRSGRVVGAEALVRWDHPQRGRLLPGEFIALAEDNGVVHDLGAWVLTTACRQLASWLEELPNLGRFSLAVNLSGRQLEHPDLVDVVAEAIDRTGVAPGRLDLEVTESVLMRDVGHSAEILGTLKALGVNISVDDFGTGYSSLSYLRRFPVDRLKVDRSFVAGLGSQPEDSAIVGAIVNLAHALGLVAVGEGVETPTQARALRAMGCDLAQGYHFGSPMPAAELARALRRRRGN
jgi:diguanylate cyclase (GGDEF)-like protein/PAS domain S-box-containing protein